jgi:hypothetical protein
LLSNFWNFLGFRELKKIEKHGCKVNTHIDETFKKVQNLRAYEYIEHSSTLKTVPAGSPETTATKPNDTVQKP